MECVRLELDAFEPEIVIGGLGNDRDWTPPARGVTTLQSAGSASRALEGAARVVRRAPEHNRNNALNWAGHALGKHVAAGELELDHVKVELRAAALAAGLDERETENTIRSGLDAGMAV